MTYRELRGKLRRLGFEFIRHGGRHDIWGIRGTKTWTPVPRHRGEVPPGTLASILRELDLRREDLEGR